MQLFKRILKFDKEAEEAPNEKRKLQRYAVGPTFPFKAVLNLLLHDGEGAVNTNDRNGQDWAGKLVNLSTSGASIQVHPAAAASRGEPCQLKFSLDAYQLDLPATVAHFWNYRDHSLCGIAFSFPDSETQRAYLQLLQPVVIGASLTPVDTVKVKQDAPGLKKEQFVGHSVTLLTIWRDAAAGGVHSFDFRMNRYGVRWTTGMEELDIYGLAADAPVAKEAATAVVKLTAAQQEDVRWLFCLAVPNLAKTVPLDVRKFLSQLVA
ncbi:MAG: PilZ domain-containing protein [Opitutales bacterium]